MGAVDVLLLLQAFGYALGCIAALVSSVAFYRWLTTHDREWMLGVLGIIFVLTMLFYDTLGGFK